MKKFVLNHIFELVGGVFSIIGIGVLAVGIIVLSPSLIPFESSKFHSKVNVIVARSGAMTISEISKQHHIKTCKITDPNVSFQ